MLPFCKIRSKHEVRLPRSSHGILRSVNREKKSKKTGLSDFDGLATADLLATGEGGRARVQVARPIQKRRAPIAAGISVGARHSRFAGVVEYRSICTEYMLVAIECSSKGNGKPVWLTMFTDTDQRRSFILIS